MQSLTADRRRIPFLTPYRARMMLAVTLPALLAAVASLYLAKTISNLQHRADSELNELEEDQKLIDETKANLDQARAQLIRLEQAKPTHDNLVGGQP